MSLVEPAASLTLAISASLAPICGCEGAVPAVTVTLFTEVVAPPIVKVLPATGKSPAVD